MDYQKKYLKYKNKYINLKKYTYLSSTAPPIPNPITNISVVKITAPSIPNPIPNTPAF